MAGWNSSSGTRIETLIQIGRL